MSSLPRRFVSFVCALSILLTPAFIASPSHAGIRGNAISTNSTTVPSDVTRKINAVAKKRSSKLGKPIASIRCGLPKRGCHRLYKHGAVHWMPKTGTYATWGTIHAKWKKASSEWGKYGYPAGVAKVGNDGRLRQKFQGGTISTGVISAGLPYGVKPDGGRQLIIAYSAKRSSKTGTVELWELRSDARWHRAYTFSKARFGYNGLATASAKREGDGKTPMGQYRIPFAFGTSAKPKGTTIKYRRADSNDQWCSRSKSRYYNTWMSAPNKSCPSKDAEVISRYSQYRHAAVVNYNSARKPGRGSAIFLHIHGKGSTAGCVSVTKNQMITTLKWLRPEKNPRIVIAPRGELKKQ